MVAIQSIDTSNLNSRLGGLRAVLFGTGQGGDLVQMMRIEAGQLAWEIAEELGPSSKSAAGRQLEKQMNSVLTTKPDYSTFENPEANGHSNYAGFQWLTAGPNFLLGIATEDNHPDAGAEAALRLFYASEKTVRGNRYVELGTRKAKGAHQHLLRLNRVRVSKKSRRGAAAIVRQKFGQLKAAFAATAARLIPQKRIPVWVGDQIPIVEANGKNVFNENALTNPDNPAIEFGARAAGVESNPRVVEKIQSGITNRSFAIKKKIEQVLRGYIYDWNTGAVFRKRGGEYELN